MDIHEAFEKIVTDWHRFSENNKKKYAIYKTRYKQGSLKSATKLKIIQAANLDFLKFNPIVIDGEKEPVIIKTDTKFYLCPKCLGNKTYPIRVVDLKIQIMPALLPELFRDVYIRGVQIFRDGRHVKQSDLDDFQDICSEEKVYEIFAHVRRIRKHEFRLNHIEPEYFIEAPCHVCNEVGHFER